MKTVSAFWQVSKKHVVEFFQEVQTFARDTELRIEHQKIEYELNQARLAEQQNCQHLRFDGSSTKVPFADGAAGMRLNRSICQRCRVVEDIPHQDPEIIPHHAGKIEEFVEASSENFLARFEDRA